MRQHLETGNAVAGLQVFSEDKLFQHVPVASSGAPFGCGRVSASVRTRVVYVTSVGRQGSVGCKGHPDHSELLSLGCHGDGGGSAPVQHCLYLHCFCCFQQTSHSFVAVDDGVVVDVAAVVSLVTSPAGCPALRLTLQTLRFLLQLQMWHCGYV